MTKNKPIYYSNYLQLDKILESQITESGKTSNPIHDENLFIITHQTYELWFKQIIIELKSINQMFSKNFVKESNLGLVVSRCERICKIIKLLINQVDILETMSPLDFLEFRNLLNPASGFQSAQFRIIENTMGLNRNNRIKFNKKDYDNFLSPNDQANAKSSEKEKSLLELAEIWLERTPFIVHNDFNFWEEYKNSIHNMIKEDINQIKETPGQSSDMINENIREYEKIKDSYDALFNKEKYIQLLKSGKRTISQEACLSALFIILYRHEPILHQPYQLITKFIDFDQLMQSWRNRHALLAHRMIGRKIGTGGSSGYKYLKKTSDQHSIFTDFANLSSYIIPRSCLPKLPTSLKKNLGFYFTYEDKE